MAAEFVTVRSEGGLFPPDLLHRIVGGDQDLGGLTSQDYGLAAADRLGEAAARAWSKAKAYWAAFRAATSDLPASETGVTQTREQWLLPLLRELGYRDLEYRAGAEVIADRRYLISHRSGPVPLHFVSFRQSLDRAAPSMSGQRRMSPHALLQEYLNISDASYGIVSNGLQLRLLRDSASLTRQAYLEFDLEGMFDGGVYADFVLLYLVLHRTRLPRAEIEASQCWLEQWRAKAESQGTRAMGELRNGVEEAIVALGTGFLSHPANEILRQRLNSGQLSVASYYQQLLRLIYRLIFLFVAEERDLIFPPDADPTDKRRYSEHYSASRLRNVAHKYLTDDRHDDLWRSLRITFQLLSGDRQALGVPPLGGGLFDAESCPDLDAALVRNDALAEAIRRLSWVRVGKVTRRVNYRDMDAEELGGVYEGLLERQPRLVAGEFNVRFELVGSGQRKQTGSYYTPTSLVQELLRSALEPVIADRLKKARTPERRRQALLRTTVCDPACGSGHFLLAAARRLAQELARIEAGDMEPSPADLRSALRQVIASCIYGVDRNPLAVDLCKLALWLEGHNPGKPLSFLDHRIKIGNSLVGATPELVARGIPDEAFTPVTGDDKKIASAIKKRNKEERNQYSFAGVGNGGWGDLCESLGLQSLEIGDLPQTDVRTVAEQREQYWAFRRDEVEPAELPLDVWTAAFFWPLASGQPEPPTTGLLATSKPGQPPNLSAAQMALVERLRSEHGFFHWPLEFPDVFEDEGFDCVLGNPPWETIELNEEEFFRLRDGAIASLSGVHRKSTIHALEKTNPALWAEFHETSRRMAGVAKFAKASGAFPLTGSGRINMYALFAERNRALINTRGRAGFIVPTGIATDDSTKRFFQSAVEQNGLAGLLDFENRGKLFPDVDSRMKFCLITLSGSPVEGADLAFYLTSTDQIRDERRRFQLGARDFALLNPNTRTCPVFRTKVDADLTRAIYRRVPVLIDERDGVNPWGVEFMQGLFNMTSDSDLFRGSSGPGLVPLYEAKLFHQFNHRWATYEGGDARDATAGELADPGWRVRPRYWVPRDEVEARLGGRWSREWLIAFRDITNATNERTAIFTVLPRVGAGHNAPLALLAACEPSRVACLLACANSLPLDYVARSKVGGTHLTFFILKQLPILPPTAFTGGDIEFILPRVLELVYTAWDIRAFARDCGCDGPPFRWDEERRALLRAELDAYFAALYGLNRDELRYILDPSDVYGPDFPGETFRVLKEREIRAYGEYRTRRLVLEAWDRLGLAPRNRDGRYAVEAPSFVSITASERGASAGGKPPGVQESPAAYRSGSSSVLGNSKIAFGKSATKARRASRSTVLGDAGWQDAQPMLPGMPQEGQLSFGDLPLALGGAEGESDPNPK